MNVSVIIIMQLVIFANIIAADEILLTKDGKKVLLKSDHTWEYVEDKKPVEVKYAEDAVQIWDKSLLRQDSEYEKRLGLFLHYQNNTDKKIIGVIVKVTILNPFGKSVLETTFEDEVILKQNEKQKNTKYWLFKDNQFIDDEPYDRMWSMADNGTAKINTQILKVVFDDGTILSAKTIKKK